MLTTKTRLNILALDVGEKRVGVALARADVWVPVALPTLIRQDAQFWEDLERIIADHDIQRIVLGLPRGLDGQQTAQTKITQAFARELASRSTLPIDWQDEALTSVKAETVLGSHGKPYAKSDVDALAASFILADYLEGAGR